MDTETITGTISLTDNKKPVNMRCPRCRKEGVFAAIGGHDAGWDVMAKRNNQNYIEGHVTLGYRRCPNLDCNAFAFVVMSNTGLIRSYPSEVIDFDSSNLPPRIRASLEEAVKAHSVACYRASALMVRRVLEELCEDKQATGDNLLKRIAALSNTVVIPKELLVAADELRLLGNDAAHIEAKTYDQIGPEECAIAIELAKELLKAVYQYSSLVARLQSLKKQPPGGEAV